MIAIVRSEECAKQYDKEFGLKYIVNCNGNDFQQRIRSLIKELQPNTYVSCVGGSLPGQVFDLMPPKSMMIILGSMTGKDIVLPSSDFYYQSKSIRGFFLLRYVREELDP